MSAAYDFTIGASLLREAVGHATISLWAKWVRYLIIISLYIPDSSGLGPTLTLITSTFLEVFEIRVKSLKFFFFLFQPYHGECWTQLTHFDRIFPHRIPQGIDIATKTTMLGRLHTSRVDERCQRWPNALYRVEKDVRANLANAFDLLEQFPDVRGRWICLFEEIAEIIVYVYERSQWQVSWRARIKI